MPAPKLLVLHLCSGPAGRPDGLAHCIAELGLAIEAVEVVNYSCDDLTNDQFWLSFKIRLRSGCFVALGGPPRKNLLESRTVQQGPPRLRWHDCPFGVPVDDTCVANMSEFHFEQLAIDDVIAQGKSVAGKIMRSLARLLGF